MSTRFSIVTRGGNAKNSCPSAIDAAGYISREELYCEYDGHTYKPDPKEDLVHSEINLPENAPEEYKDRATLWNSVEAIEKQKNSQLCRTFKASLPNAWTYEVAEEVVRKYVMENFVSNQLWSSSTFSVGGRNGNKSLFSMRVFGGPSFIHKWIEVYIDIYEYYAKIIFNKTYFNKISFSKENY